LREIEPVLKDRRDAVLARIANMDRQLRDEFAQLEALDYRADSDACLAILKKTFSPR
jgi:hypothetical protein